MIILALEFSSEQRSVAVHRGAVQGVPQILAEAIETGGRSTKAFGMIEQALREAGLEREQIDCLAVGLGPGSYTGIRAGIAVAQGWQLVRAVQSCGISSADCIAAQAQEEGVRGEFGVVIDAQRNEFYLRIYKADDHEHEVKSPLRLVTQSELSTVHSTGLKLVGPEVTRWFPDGRCIVPRASALARLAGLESEFVSADKLEPIYLRETAYVKAPATKQIG